MPARSPPPSASSTAPSISIQEKTKQDPLQVFHEALRNVAPALEVQARAASAAPPIRCRWKCATDRSRALAIRWLINAARSRNEPTMTGRLSGELLDAANNRGNAVKKREDTHKMAEANRAFSHYRW